MAGIISDPGGFAQLCGELQAEPAIGLDTEFLRERTYFAQLCLMQLSGAARTECIDTLAIEDLSPLRPLMGEPRLCKVLHAARQDQEVLWPATGAITGLFDTQVAAALIGLPAQVGYAELVRQLLQVTLPKAETRTDWSRRPLTSAQLTYALDDVRYLLPLRERLTERLRQLERWSWFCEEMAQLDGAGPFTVEPEQAWRRIKGLSELDPSRLELARRLGAWRERRAVSADRPRNWILPDVALREMVLRVPRSSAELAQIVELPEGIRANSGRELLAVIEDSGLPAQLPPLPQRQRPDALSSDTVRRLMQLVQQIGRELGMAAEVLATRRELERLVAGERAGALLTGWRRQVIGERLLGAL
jgi:ribonuclease D